MAVFNEMKQSESDGKERWEGRREKRMVATQKEDGEFVARTKHLTSFACKYK